MLRQHCRTEQHRSVLACLVDIRTKGNVPNASTVQTSTKVLAARLINILPIIFSFL